MHYKSTFFLSFGGGTFLFAKQKTIFLFGEREGGGCTFMDVPCW